MSWLHCDDCHHEFAGDTGARCDWCRGTSHVLEDRTPLARMMKDWSAQGRSTRRKLRGFLEPSVVAEPADVSVST